MKLSSRWYAVVVVGAGMAASDLEGRGMKRFLFARKGLLILEGPLLTMGRPLLSLEVLFADFGGEAA